MTSTSTTTPVTTRDPSGTTTRAPTTARGSPSGTRYVRKSSCGTGTATLISKQRSYKLHVLPHLALRGWVSEQVRRMEGGNEFGPAVVENPPAQLGDGVEGSQESARGE